jgi:hypothetical protein
MSAVRSTCREGSVSTEFEQGEHKKREQGEQRGSRVSTEEGLGAQRGRAK